MALLAHWPAREIDLHKIRQNHAMQPTIHRRLFSRATILGESWYRIPKIQARECEQKIQPRFVNGGVIKLPVIQRLCCTVEMYVKQTKVRHRAVDKLTSLLNLESIKER